MTSTVGERTLAVTLPPDAIRPGETFVLVWSILPMTDPELEQMNGDPNLVGEIREGFRSSIEFDVATGPIAPCQPVFSDSM